MNFRVWRIYNHKIGVIVILEMIYYSAHPFCITSSHSRPKDVPNHHGTGYNLLPLSHVLTDRNFIAGRVRVFLHHYHI